MKNYLPGNYLRASSAGLACWIMTVLAPVALIFGTLPQPAEAQIAIQAKPVSIDEADRILRSRFPAQSASNVPSSSLAPTPNVVAASSYTPTPVGCASGSSQPAEIVTLASSLKCDVDLIFEYVYNNIEYEPIFGSNKGALGTLLDQRGDDIDQAQLFVALLNAAGITQTSFQYGYITLTGPTAEYCLTTGTTPPVASAPGWLGVKNDYFAILNLLSGGGIPSEGGTYNSSDGTVDCLLVAHVWVQVTLGGVNYVFDPSFKQHTVSSGLSNLGSILGYTKTQFLADAGATTDSVSISNINRAALRADLTTYASNLVGYIKANNPAFALSDVIGGKTIIPLTGSPIRQTSLPYLSTVQPSGYPQNWGGSVPNGYRTCIAITLPQSSGPGATTCANATPSPATGCATQTSVPGANTIVLFTDQTYGQRITVFSTPDPSISGNFIPKLLVNGAAPTTGVNTGTSLASGAPWSIVAAITHPFASTDANQCKTLSVNAGGSYLIGAGWGQVGRGMVQKHRQLLAQALATNAAPSSESVLGESLSVISYNWLAEYAAQQQIGDPIGQITTQYIHGVGITGQTAIQSTGDQGPYVDLPMNFLNIGPQICFPLTSCPITALYPSFFTDSGTSSSFESAVLEQTQAPTANMVAASTIRLVDINAATGAKTFFADGTSASGVSAYFTSIRPNLVSTYKTTDLSNIDYFISTNGMSTGSPAGYQVLGNRSHPPSVG